MFIVAPSELEHFNGDQLVQLLRRLMYAEARATAVPMRNVDAPLQITVADGGKDGSIQWQDGKDQTNYFPGRDIVFQCKATDRGDAQWMKEVWAKASKNKKAKALNPAVVGLLARGGSYVGVTRSPLVGDKIKDRADAIREGIRLANGDPAKLHAVDVYDGNKLAEWATIHPAVALWVKEQAAQMPLAGFATLDQWGKRADIARPAFVDAPDRNFTIGSNQADTLTFAQLAARLVDDLMETGACVRLTGPSGIGKTRALHHALSSSLETLRNLTAANFIFCDYREVSTKVWDLANKIKNDGSAAILVVDECPRTEAGKLNALAKAEGSQLRIVTIDTDGRDLGSGCLMIAPRPAAGDTIRGILASELPGAKPEEVNFIAELCDGFPRIAVLAAEAYKQGRPVIKSADDVAERIVETAKLEREPERAVECLSLFERVAPDINPADFDTAAQHLAHMKGELMYEHLITASERHIVGRYGGEMAAQPRPIADYLGVRRLNTLRPSTVMAFLRNGPPTYRDSMLSRFRHLARSATLMNVVQTMLYRGGGLTEHEELLGQAGAPFLAAFVHVAPDLMAIALRDAIVSTSLDALAQAPLSGSLLEALRLLASRRESFPLAAVSLVRLVAAHGVQDKDPLLEHLKQLFQVALSGTEASDGLRKEVLAEMLLDGEPRVKQACVEVLGAMLTTYMTRFGDFDQVGHEAIRSDWAPPSQDAIRAYFDWSLERLLEAWEAAPDFRPRIQALVAEQIRTLIGFGQFATIERFVRRVLAVEGLWSDASKALGDWLYFDRLKADGQLAAAVRALYDRALPTDPVDLALFFSRYWPADIRDPDEHYGEHDIEADLRYAAQRVAQLAPGIARDAGQMERVLAAINTQEMHAPQALAKGLAEHLAIPVESFEQAVAALDQSGERLGLEFSRLLLRYFEQRLADDPGAIERLVEIARASPVMAANPMTIFTALEVTDDRVAEIAAEVRVGNIDPFNVVQISYGRGLDEVSLAALRDLVTALVDRVADGGAWAALEILSMRTHEQKQMTPQMAELVKLAVLSPTIAEGVKGNATTADYVFGRLIGLLAASDAVDNAFAEAFTQQIVATCRSSPGGYPRQSDALRSGLGVITAIAPDPVWAVLAGFFETATRLERDRLSRIIGAAKPFTHDVDRTGPGVLFAIPRETMTQWADADPDNRAGFLVGAYPILQRNDDGWRWHPAFQDLADRYGASRTFRAALRARILPSSWGGSLTAHLEAFKTVLGTWKRDPTLGDWAMATAEVVDRWLEGDR